jgi:hypothetical protein
MILRISLYATLGTTLSALGHSVDDVAFWLIFALFWATEHLARVELVEPVHQAVKKLEAERQRLNKDNDV